MHDAEASPALPSTASRPHLRLAKPGLCTSAQQTRVLEADASGTCCRGESAVPRKAERASRLNGRSPAPCRVLAFYSRMLDLSQRNYPIHDKELLAIVACHAGGTSCPTSTRRSYPISQAAPCRASRSFADSGPACGSRSHSPKRRQAEVEGESLDARLYRACRAPYVPVLSIIVQARHAARPRNRRARLAMRSVVLIDQQSSDLISRRRTRRISTEHSCCLLLRQPTSGGAGDIGLVESLMMSIGLVRRLRCWSQWLRRWLCWALGCWRSLATAITRQDRGVSARHVAGGASLEADPVPEHLAFQFLGPGGHFLRNGSRAGTGAASVTACRAAAPDGRRSR